MESNLESDLELADAERHLRKAAQSLQWIGKYTEEVSKIMNILDSLKEKED